MLVEPSASGNYCTSLVLINKRLAGIADLYLISFVCTGRNNDNSSGVQVNVGPQRTDPSLGSWADSKIPEVREWALSATVPADAWISAVGKQNPSPNF